MRLLAFALLTCLSLPALAGLGRLFYTPAQRATLEDARHRNITAAAAQTDPGGAIVYNGVVLRSDGRTTQWVDGQAQARPGADYHADGHRLQPGQMLYDGKVYEPYQVIRSKP